MKQLFIILILVIAILPACKKDTAVRTSGTDTIDNTIHMDVTYFAYGFSFSQAKLIATTSAPGPDVVLFLNDDNTPSRLVLQANNRLPSFFKVGEYASDEEAKEVFNNLKTVPEAQQWFSIAEPIVPNQVWIYRANDEKYTKFRIIETVNEMMEDIVAYGECTFKWVHQPDGSVNFP
ncbi:MAG: hypothetical protein LBV26_01395 [Bacteroidales bacterium]|jgi:hypothetical protein|nr:hypothetical protein [Bacteroidales bacterium]